MSESTFSAVAVEMIFDLPGSVGLLLLTTG